MFIMFEFSKYIFFISLWFITSLALSQTAAHNSLGYSKKDQLIVQDKPSGEQIRTYCVFY